VVVQCKSTSSSGNAYQLLFERLANMPIPIGRRLPFLAGAISGARGVQSLQPFILALLVLLIIIWALLPRNKHRSHST
jgi:hypothetical protein